MTLGMFPPKLISIVTPVTITNTDNDGTQGSATTFTFSGKSIGAAAANRRVYVGVFGSSAQSSISSVTIGGNTATNHVSRNDSNRLAGIYSYPLTTGTTANIVVTFPGSENRCFIGVWAAYGADATPHDTLSSGASSSTGTIDIPEGGALIAYAHNNGGSATFTWAGATEDFDDVPSGGTESHSGAHADEMAEETGRTVTATPSSVQAPGLVAVSLAPA